MTALSLFSTPYSLGNNIINFVKPAIALGTISIALNAIQNLGVKADPVYIDGYDLGDLIFWKEKNCDKFFGKISEISGFGYCSRLQLCKKKGLENCMKDPSTRETALNVMKHAVSDVLQKHIAQTLSKEQGKLNGGELVIEDCFSSLYCPDIDAKKIHPREKKATEMVYTCRPINSTREHLTQWIQSAFIPPEWRDVQEILRFRNDDPREKFLYLSAEHDRNGALDPSHVADFLSKLSQKYDLKFAVVRSPEDICKAVKSAEKTKNLANVLIDGHGDPESISIGGKGKYAESSIWKSENFSSCFSGLRPNGKILLTSCSTGAPYQNRPFDNIAQKIANDAKRVVVAPKNSITGKLTSLLSSDTSMLYHPGERLYTYIPFFNTNLFKIFKPSFHQCSPLDKKSMHKREIAATEAIKTDLAAKSLLPDSVTFEGTQEYLQLCKDDPRDKILFLSAEYPADKQGNEGALDPDHSSKLLGVFADKFDLQYAIVHSLKEICDAVRKASGFGKIAGVIIEGHATKDGGMILSKDLKGKDEKLTIDSDFKCLSKVEPEATIILNGGSLGQDGLNPKNIAQKIANDSQRSVIASICPVSGERTEIQSIEPMIFNHPSYSWWENFSNKCPENENKNIFKTFEPKK